MLWRRNQTLHRPVLAVGLVVWPYAQQHSVVQARATWTPGARSRASTRRASWRRAASSFCTGAQALQGLRQACLHSPAAGLYFPGAAAISAAQVYLTELPASSICSEGAAASAPADKTYLVHLEHGNPVAVLACPALSPTGLNCLCMLYSIPHTEFVTLCVGMLCRKHQAQK